MSVFISYRHTDRDTAVQIAHEFDANNVKYYLDVIDDESRSTEDITEVITKNIKSCTHLLALVSSNTQGSWWVPFEIGQATIANCRICSFAKSNFTSLNRFFLKSNYYDFLPEYLLKWPILLNMNDLDIFIKEYKKDIHNSINEGIESWRAKGDSSTSRGLTKKGAQEFHNSLKSKL